MTQKPSDQILESVSALVDNEASEIELHRILKNVGRDDVVRERWRRYHLIGSVMRRERMLIDSFDVSSAVAKAIAQDAVLDNGDAVALDRSGVSTPSPWRSLLAKSGVAASFAAVVVLGFQFAGSGQLPAETELATAGVASGEAAEPAVAVTNVVPFGFELPIPQARNVSTNPSSMMSSMMYSPAESDLRALLPQEPSQDLSDAQTQDLLNRLLIEHAQRSSVNGGLGILPFARVFKMEESSAQPSAQ